jgi:hypothetical protein
MARHPRRISSLSRPDYQETPSSFERKNYSSFEQAATPLKKFLDSIAGKSSKDWVDKYQHEFLDFLGRRHPRIACFHPAKQES